jgi:hypothetical protein
MDKTALDHTAVGTSVASLMAAAPELFDAAKVFAFGIPDGVADDLQIGTISNIPVYAREIRRLNAAIAKAKGE